MFLCQVHHCLAGVFEVALAEEVGRHVEEIIMYLTATIKVDSPGALLCLQQVMKWLGENSSFLLFFLILINLLLLFYRN